MGIAVLWRCLLMPGTRHDVFVTRERVGLRMGPHFRMSSYHSWMGGMFLRPTVGTRFCMADELSRFEIEATVSDEARFNIVIPELDVSSSPFISKNLI